MRVTDYLDSLHSKQAAGVIDLYSAELHECHRLLDFVGIPKTGFEEQLSIAQRVKIAVGLLVRARIHGGGTQGEGSGYAIHLVK